jgi:hypothetical protein
MPPWQSSFLIGKLPSVELSNQSTDICIRSGCEDTGSNSDIGYRNPGSWPFALFLGVNGRGRSQCSCPYTTLAILFKKPSRNDIELHPP